MGSQPSRCLSAKEAPVLRVLHPLELRELRRNSLQIDLNIEEEQRKLRSSVKVLLLGPGESGKSTILKQLRILYDDGFKKQECIAKREIIFTITVLTMVRMLEDMVASNQFFSDSDRNDDLDTLWDAKYTFDTIRLITRAVAGALERLWADSAVQEFYETYSKYNEDGNFYFLHHIDRICSVDYLPSPTDVLNLRIQSIGVKEIQFTLNDLTFRVVDVGGQKSQRKKWIHSFEGVNAVIFVGALSDYNRVMQEDEEMNRIQDAISLFGTVCGSPWFANSNMILFLNKKDLLAKKLDLFPLKDCFSDYIQEAPVHEKAVYFIRQKFLAVAGDDSNKPIFVHEVCALDSNQMKPVFAGCTELIVAKYMEKMKRSLIEEEEKPEENETDAAETSEAKYSDYDEYDD